MKDRKEYKALAVDLATFLDDNGIKFKTNSTNQLIMDECYNCHRAKKLYVNRETGVHVCFRCEAKGGPIPLVAKYLDISFKEASLKLYGKDAKIKVSAESLDDEENTEAFTLSLGGLQKNKFSAKDQAPEPMSLPPELKLLTAQFKAPWEYLKRRGYKDQDILDLKLLVLPYETFNDAWKATETRLKKEGLSGEKLKEEIKKVIRYFERIVFPVYVDGNVLGFVARDWTGTKDPKVLNSTGNFRSFFVWNYDNAKNSEELIVCEGTSSGVKCGIQRAIGLLGKMATPGQIRLIRKTKAKRIYLCLDVGTQKEQSKIFNALAMFYAGRIYQVKMPEIVALKEDKLAALNLSDLEKFNQFFGVGLKLTKDRELEFLYEDKLKVLEVARINPKLTSEQKQEALVRFITNAQLNVSASFFNWVVFKSEYKDAGDYTHEQMDELIKAAKPLKSTDFTQEI